MSYITDNMPKSNKRIILKLSGEMLSSEHNANYDEVVIQNLALQIQALVKRGCQLGIVIGGGNICRGKNMSMKSLNRVTADQMGMLATLINGLMIRDTLSDLGLKAKLLSSKAIEGVCDAFDIIQAKSYLDKGSVLILGGGTGNPFFSTDTAAVLRAVELECDFLVKCTKVDGVYDKDPYVFKDAVKYPHLYHEDALRLNLKFMDLPAIALAQENHLKIKIGNGYDNNFLANIFQDTGPFSTIFCKLTSNISSEAIHAN